MLITVVSYLFPQRHKGHKEMLIKYIPLWSWCLCGKYCSLP